MRVSELSKVTPSTEVRMLASERLQEGIKNNRLIIKESQMMDVHYSMRLITY